MKTLLNITVLALALVVSNECSGLTLLRDINSPNDCPEGLTIKCKLNNGMIEFEIEVDTEEVVHAGDLYKGRTGAHALLNIGALEQQVASVTLHGNVKSKKTTYRFRLSPSAAKSSELQLGVSLYEKDGMVTIGGGVSMKIRLIGFEPQDTKAK